MRPLLCPDRISPLLTKYRQGFTLIELVVVIAVTGVIAAVVAVFLRGPVLGFVDTARRAELTDAADTALRRIGRDVRLALPNSVRVTVVGGVTYLEFLLVRTGGRYRFENTAATTTGCPGGAGTDPALDVLSFSAADNCFKTIGNIPNIAQVTSTDFVVVFNLPPGTANANAYEFPGTGGNKSLVSSATAGASEDRINLPATHLFTFESPGRRFFIIEGPVTYACDPVAGTVTRHSGYAIAAVQPPPPALPAGALLASRVTDCTITYDASVVAQQAGLVTLRLTLSRDGETVTLYHAVHISNVP